MKENGGKNERQTGTGISRLYLLLAMLARLPVVQAEHVSEIVSFASCGVLLLAGLVLTFIKKAGLWPLGTAVYLTVRLLMLARRADAER